MLQSDEFWPVLACTEFCSLFKPSTAIGLALLRFLLCNLIVALVGIVNLLVWQNNWSSPIIGTVLMHVHLCVHFRAARITLQYMNFLHQNAIAAAMDKVAQVVLQLTRKM